MTMFEELFALASSATLTLTICADETSGRMTINVIPKPKKEASEPALSQALSLTATPQEFEAGFIDALRGYRQVRQTLAQQVEATAEVLEAARAASVKKAGDATRKAVTVKPAGVTSRTDHAPAGVKPAGESTDDSGDDAPMQQGPAAQAPQATAGASFDLFG